jgi:putative acetyltransferase
VSALTPPGPVTLRPATSRDTPAVRALVFGILAEFGFTPDPAGTDADLEDLELSYSRRGGTFEVAVGPNGELLGCVGLYPLEMETVELRKMYLRADARGLGLGRRLLAHALDVAHDRGYGTVVLQTASVLERAVSMYRRAGFEPYQPEVWVPRCDIALRLRLPRRDLSRAPGV